MPMLKTVIKGYRGVDKLINCS